MPYEPRSRSATNGLPDVSRNRGLLMQLMEPKGGGRGEIVKRYVGEPDFAELHRLIESLLAQT